MNAHSLFTRTRLGMDTRIWVTFIIAVLFSGALLAARVALTDSCRAITVSAFNSDRPDAADYFPNDRITFTAKVDGSSKDISWDFGDNTGGKGARITHNYNKPGTYFITATVNDKCREFISVIVRPQMIQSSATTNGEPFINGPEAPKVGETVNYYASVNGEVYEWNVLNSPNYPTQRIAVAAYIFNNEGLKTIELKVDGRVIRKDIHVLPADNQPMAPLPQMQPAQGPTEAAPEAVPAATAKVIPPEEFTDMLKKVGKGDMNATSFDPYLCEGGSASVRVLLNDKNWTTLSAFCDKIFKNKKYNIKNTQVIRDDNGCVKQLKVSYCKWIILGLKCKEE